MPVNFNLLSAIPAPEIRGQLPIQPNPAGQFASGLLGGLAQGQQIAASRQAMAAQQQQMQQSAQLFPGQLKGQQQALQSGDMANKSAQIDLSNKEVQQQYATQLRDAAAKGEQQYMAALMPDDRNAYLMKKAQLHTEISNAAKNFGEANKNNAAANKDNASATQISLTNSGQITHMAAIVMANASAIGDPQKREAQYQTALMTLPSAIQKIMPPQYDEQKAAALMNLDKTVHADALQKMADAQPKSEIEKTTEYLSKLKAQINDTEPGSPEQKAAQDKFDTAFQQVRENQGLWSRIKDKIANLIPSSSNASKPATPLIPVGRVGVVGPDGKQYHIPQTQLQDAIKQGYKPLGQ